MAFARRNDYAGSILAIVKSALAFFRHVPVDQAELAGQADGFHEAWSRYPRRSRASSDETRSKIGSERFGNVFFERRARSRLGWTRALVPHRALRWRRPHSRAASAIQAKQRDRSWWTTTTEDAASCSSVGNARFDRREQWWARCLVQHRTDPVAPYWPPDLSLEATPIAALDDSRTGFGAELSSPALRIPTIQTGRTPIHQDDRIRIALGAHGRTGREGGRGLGGLFQSRFGADAGYV